jgi:hypothetical protein
MGNRPFQITENSTACNGRFREWPALRDVAAALRTTSWTPTRYWSKIVKDVIFCLINDGIIMFLWSWPWR